jgi:hypothetical protein
VRGPVGVEDGGGVGAREGEGVGEFVGELGGGVEGRGEGEDGECAASGGVPVYGDVLLLLYKRWG